MRYIAPRYIIYSTAIYVLSIFFCILGIRKQAIESEVKKLENLIVRDLCQKWEGQASDKYRNEFTTLKSQVMDKFTTMLGELNTQLTEISNAIEDADRQIKAEKLSLLR